MSEDSGNGQATRSVEDVLHAELARGDGILAATRPILRHLLADDGRTLFSDEIVATMRGMMTHIARQLLFAQARARDIEDLGAFADERQNDLAFIFFEDSALLAQAHALTLERQLTIQLQQRSGIDSVLSPLLQELTASQDATKAASAMRVLASQARFLQQQRRMELPLAELPADLFHKALVIFTSFAGEAEDVQAATKNLRGSFDEGEGRLGQLMQLVVAMGRKAQRALAIDHAGVAIFATALALASGQDRNLAILSFSENQLTRLALSLRAAGLNQTALEEQFLYLHPDTDLPFGLENLAAERAASLLSASQSHAFA